MKVCRKNFGLVTFGQKAGNLREYVHTCVNNFVTEVTTAEVDIHRHWPGLTCVSPSRGLHNAK